MLGSPEAPVKMRSFVLIGGEWRLTALSVGPGPAESAIGANGEMTHRGEIQVWPFVPWYAALDQESVERFQALVAVAVDPSGSSKGQRRLVRQTRNASGM